MPVLIDTNALLALADQRSRSHRSVANYVATTTDLLSVPITVLPELDYLLMSRLGIRAEVEVLQSIRDGDFPVEDFTVHDLGRSLELIERYADSNIGFVDASIVAIAERLHITRILTLDVRHFRMFRPRHCEFFELVP